MNIVLFLVFIVLKLIFIYLFCGKIVFSFIFVFSKVEIICNNGLKKIGLIFMYLIKIKMIMRIKKIIKNGSNKCLIFL